MRDYERQSYENMLRELATERNIPISESVFKSYGECLDVPLLRHIHFEVLRYLDTYHDLSLIEPLILEKLKKERPREVLSKLYLQGNDDNPFEKALE